VSGARSCTGATEAAGSAGCSAAFGLRAHSVRCGGPLSVKAPVRSSPVARFQLARWGVAGIVSRISTRLAPWAADSPGDGERGSMSRDAEFVKEVQKKFEQKLREHEISVIEHWRERLDRIYAMRPEGIAPLQLEIRKLSENMANRVSTLKKG
jgi:hypothetical protein